MSHLENNMPYGNQEAKQAQKQDNGQLHMTSVDNTAVPFSKPHLLFYAHYYAPDKASTGQLIQDLAEGMLDTFRVTVICVVPSYLGVIEDKWKTQKYYFENINGVDIVRVAVPEFTKSSKKSRVKNILAYFFRAMKATGKVGKVDYVMSVSQPPILGGLLGVWGKWTLKSDSGKRARYRNSIYLYKRKVHSQDVGDGLAETAAEETAVSDNGSKLKKPRYIYQIQDFNPEQVLAVNYSKNKAITGLMMFLDKFSCKHADLVITVGRDLIDTLNGRFPKGNVPKSVLINNWIDEKEIYPLEADHPRVVEFKKKYGLDDKFVIMYSGNIGLYYDLENLMKVIEKFKDAHTPASDNYPNGREVVFAFVGAGSVLDKLILYKKEHNLDNVTFIPYQDKEDLIYSLNAGDVHWCVNAKGIKGISVPSKAYGIMAAGKPILGVLDRGSEARLLIEETGCGKCHRPGDYEGIEDLVRWFIENGEGDEVKEMGLRGREYLVENLTKDISIEKYKKAILEN